MSDEASVRLLQEDASRWEYEARLYMRRYSEARAVSDRLDRDRQEWEATAEAALQELDEAQARVESLETGLEKTLAAWFKQVTALREALDALEAEAHELRKRSKHPLAGTGSGYLNQSIGIAEAVKRMRAALDDIEQEN